MWRFTISHLPSSNVFSRHTLLMHRADSAALRMALPVWLKKKFSCVATSEREIGEATNAGSSFMDHHESHAASAFFPSPFDEAAILTLDGVGEWSTATIGSGPAISIQLTHQMVSRIRLACFIRPSPITAASSVNSGEYKLMGLAPYGRAPYRTRSSSISLI